MAVPRTRRRKRAPQGCRLFSDFDMDASLLDLSVARSGEDQCGFVAEGAREGTGGRFRYSSRRRVIAWAKSGPVREGRKTLSFGSAAVAKAGGAVVPASASSSLGV